MKNSDIELWEITSAEKKKLPHISLDIFSEHLASKEGNLQMNELQIWTQEEVTGMSPHTYSK